MRYLILFSIALTIFGIIASGLVLYKIRVSRIKEHVKGKPIFPKIKRYLDECRFISYHVFVGFHASVIGFFLFLIFKSISELNFQMISKYILFALLFLGPMNLFVYVVVHMHRKAILKDLFRVHEILYWQAKIKTPEDKSLAYASDLINGPLKQKIIELSGSYRLRRDVVAKLEEVRLMSPIEELHAFTYMLEEKYKTGMTEDYHKTSMEILKRLRRVDKKVKKIANLQLLFVSAVVLFGLFFIIIGGPLIIDAYRQFKLIF